MYKFCRFDVFFVSVSVCIVYYVLTQVFMGVLGGEGSMLEAFWLNCSQNGSLVKPPKRSIHLQTSAVLCRKRTNGDTPVEPLL